MAYEVKPERQVADERAGLPLLQSEYSASFARHGVYAAVAA
jgi:hypothetical protein